MKITRFVNGIRVNKPFNSDIVINNDVVSSTIDKVNRRLRENSKIDDVVTEQNRNE